MLESVFERVLRRDRQGVIAMIAIIVLASWAYVLTGAGMGMPASAMSSFYMALGYAATPGEGTMSGMDSVSGAMQAMAMPAERTFGYFMLMFFMWWIMMIAMMLPSAAPMVLLHAAILRKSAKGKAEYAPPWSTACFTGGYLVAWAGFSIVAAALQWLFQKTGILSPMMMMNSTNALFAAGLLLFAGFYQLTPVKQACLRHCRGPIQFLTQHWRAGSMGALRMGLNHGAYCLGCCWGLMAILFFGGIMNLYWIVGLALVVLLEKIISIGRQFSLVTGSLFLIWGAAYLYVALV